MSAEGQPGTIDGLTEYLCPIKVSCRVLYGLYSDGLHSYGHKIVVVYIDTAYIVMAYIAMAYIVMMPL